MTAKRHRSWTARPVRRGAIAGFLVLVAVLLCNSSAQAAATISGGLGGEMLTNPVPGPVGPAPNVFPVPSPVPREPGFAPPSAPPSRVTFPVPEPSNGVNDGPGSGPPAAPPVRVDAGTPPADAGKPGGKGAHEPVGKLSRADDKYLKRKGTDPHRVKGANGLDSRFDIYLDQEGSMFGVRKGTEPRLGEFLGHVDDDW